MARSAAKVVPLRQTSLSGNLPPRKPKNIDVRPRDYLTEPEIDRLVKAAKDLGRHGHRDAALIMVMYRHALRVSEAVALQWAHISMEGRNHQIHVHRLKGSMDAIHPLRGPEIRALKKLRKDYPDSPYVFCNEKGGPLSDSSIRKIIARAGEKANIGFPVNSHAMRHSCGYKLANDGVDTRALQAYMGHRNIQHTTRYTEIAPNRFKDFWDD